MSRVDAHLHFWHLARGDYHWLTPAAGPLYRDFAPADIAATLAARDIGAAVAVQAAPTEAETRYLFALARAEPRIAAVVGWTDFEAADAGARIAALHRDGAGRLQGLRPMVQDIADPGWLAHPELDAAFEALIAHDLAFDALVRPRHFPALQARLRRHPALRVVIDHAGKPDIAGDGFAAWADGLAALAAHPGVHCKLSGLLSEAGPGAGADALAPYVAQLFACFGPQRLMWGSDWPVLTARHAYGEWLALATALVRAQDATAEAAVFAATAIDFYRLPAQADPTHGAPP